MVLKVSVRYEARVTVADSSADLSEDVSNDFLGQTTSSVVLFNEIVQIADITASIFHHQVQFGLRVDHLIQLDDVWVLLFGEARKQPDLLAELMQIFIVES